MRTFARSGSSLHRTFSSCRFHANTPSNMRPRSRISRKTGYEKDGSLSQTRSPGLDTGSVLSSIALMSAKTVETAPMPSVSERTTIAVKARLLAISRMRSEEHTSELQSLAYLVCRLLLEKKKKKQRSYIRVH